MEFIYREQELSDPKQARQNTFLLTNGLGGYVSMSSVFSVPRCDQGVLVAAVKAPNERINLVHRLLEKLFVGGQEVFLSSQSFADGTPAEEGWKYLKQFSYEHIPVWEYEAGPVVVNRFCCIENSANASYVLYHIRNSGAEPCRMQVTPYFKFAPKEEALSEKKTLEFRSGLVCVDEYSMRIRTSGTLEQTEEQWQMLSYPEDAKDGRPEKGLAGSCCSICKTIQPGEESLLEVAFVLDETFSSGWEVLQDTIERKKQLEENCDLADPVGRQLAVSADAYIARRDSTAGKTILAGYPLFSDWGRDTMIALPGCTLATGRYLDAKSILETFLAYEQDGLVPNLFPEGDQAPMYNTVDAALLLIDCVWQYVQRTADWDFVRQAWPTLEHIISCYQNGTHHDIGMDGDGLLHAGRGKDQVTWMDVCVDGILPTPRHGKPVEINAYWYNALKIMGRMGKKLGEDWLAYEDLARKVRRSFVEKFYMPDRGYLRDVVSGSACDEQIRCNQIWALSMSFTMLEADQEKQVLETVRKHLYTPFGLRTLSPQDAQYQPFYGGSQLQRDLAYHQGTTWVFPLGAYYRAYLKVHGNSKEAVAQVRKGLANLVPMMKQGCAGQLPEIYDGDDPRDGKGCFAQAWSVGELLRVYETIQKIEKGAC